MNSPFGSTQFIPGLGYVEGGVSGTGPLHGEADVMMISGLGADGPATVSTRSDTGQVMATSGSFKLGTALSVKVRVLGIELPLWAWVLIGAGALGAGWVFFKKWKR